MKHHKLELPHYNQLGSWNITTGTVLQMFIQKFTNSLYVIKCTDYVIGEYKKLDFLVAAPHLWNSRMFFILSCGPLKTVSAIL